MGMLNDRRLDVMRDDDARPLFVKAPDQMWVKPVSVSLKPVDRGSSAMELLASFGKSTELDFVIAPPCDTVTPGLRPAKPSATTFEDFLKLASASDVEIQQFASRFGPLLIFCGVLETPEANVDTLIITRILQCVAVLREVHESTAAHRSRLPRGSNSAAR